jgi:hypothetical protein
MIRRIRAKTAVILGAIGLFAATGCDTYDSGGPSTRVSVGYYDGPGWYDPYYRNRCCYNTVVVRPPAHRPPHARPPGGRPPGARPPGGRPRPTPLPATPRPRPRR